MAGIVGPFELLKSIGTGGMAEVWSAIYPPTNALVAVKVLKTRRGDRAFQLAFRREVRAAASLDHPHIATIHDQGTTAADEAFPAGTPWLAMELARHVGGKDRATLATVKQRMNERTIELLSDSPGTGPSA